MSGNTTPRWTQEVWDSIVKDTIPGWQNRPLTIGNGDTFTIRGDTVTVGGEGEANTFAGFIFHPTTYAPKPKPKPEPEGMVGALDFLPDLMPAVGELIVTVKTAVGTQVIFNEEIFFLGAVGEGTKRWVEVEFRNVDEITVTSEFLGRVNAEIRMRGVALYAGDPGRHPMGWGNLIQEETAVTPGDTLTFRAGGIRARTELPLA